MITIILGIVVLVLIGILICLLMAYNEVRDELDDMTVTAVELEDEVAEKQDELDAAKLRVNELLQQFESFDSEQRQRARQLEKRLYSQYKCRAWMRDMLQQVLETCPDTLRGTQWDEETEPEAVADSQYEDDPFI